MKSSWKFVRNIHHPAKSDKIFFKVGTPNVHSTFPVPHCTVIKKLLNSWFDEKIFGKSKFLVFPHYYTVRCAHILTCKMLIWRKFCENTVAVKFCRFYCVHCAVHMYVMYITKLPIHAVFMKFNNFNIFANRCDSDWISTYRTSAISTHGYYSTLVFKGEGTIQGRVLFKV